MRISTLSWITTALILSIAVTGCLFDDNPNSPTISPALAARIDGDIWNAGLPMATRVVPPYDVTMVGSKGNDVVTLNVTARAPGTFIMGGTTSEASAIIRWNNEEYTTRHPGCSGKLVIDTYDESGRLLSGAFECVAKNVRGETITVTDGTFENVAWTEQ